MQYKIDSPILKDARCLAKTPDGVSGIRFKPLVYTNASEELLACRKTAWLGTGLDGCPTCDISGPDAVRFLNYYCTNADFSKAKYGRVRHVLMCNEKGQLLADGVLIRIGENRFRTYWLAPIIEIYAKICGINVQAERITNEFFFQLDGPKSLEILEAAAQTDLHDIAFAHWKEIGIAGKPVRVLRLGMSGALAYELHGANEDADTVYSAVRGAGREFGLRQLGRLQYCVNHTQAGYANQYIHYHFPYHSSGEQIDEMIGDYMNFSMPGSCMGNMEDYYVTPYDVGWGNLVNFNHEFVGKAALQEIAGIQPNRCVTLVWNAQDVGEVYASRFSGTDVEPFEDISGDLDWRTEENIGMRMDQVLIGDRKVGRTSGRINDYYHRRVISLAFIETAYSQDGTEVEILWGTPGKPQKRIRAIVAECPYYHGEYRNETFDVSAIPRKYATAVDQEIALSERSNA